MSWVAASFWSDRAQKRATTLETWIYRAAMIAGGILLAPWTRPIAGREANLGSQLRWCVCACGRDVGGTFPDVVGTYLSRIIVVKRDRPQEGP